MAVYSMTGFASVHAGARPADPSAAAVPAIGLEVRSVNSRFLDLSMRLPDELRGHEPALRELLNRELRRGKVELRAWLDSRTEDALPAPAVAQLQRLAVLQDQVRGWLPEARPLSVADALRLAAQVAPSPDPTAVGRQVLDLAGTAVSMLREAREREGARLVAMLRECLASLRTLAARAQPLVPELVAQQRQRFLDRWSEALANTEGGVPPQSAQDRALAEATAFAIRIDVAEELTRLIAHIDEVESLLTRGGEMGKRLDFLIQELHREANTLGSKSAVLEMTRISVDMKVLIEQMREQVQNLE